MSIPKGVIDMNAKTQRLIVREWAKLPSSEKQTDEHVARFVLKLVAKAPKTMLNVRGLNEVRDLVRPGQ
jgi:hypothetical protein